MSWICIQIGAREHYAIPRVLHQRGALQGLFTDAWVRPGNPLGLLKRSLRERYHSELAGATVISPNASMLVFETWARARGLMGWDRILARNQWFQKQALRYLSSLRSPISDLRSPTLFAYSYAALELFRFAKSRGWQTVLDQIDPGPVEFRLVAEEMKRFPKLAGVPPEFPAAYYESNRQEWELADVIVVNSRWSFDALVQQGVPAEKLVVLPLCYETEVRSQSSEPQVSGLRSPTSGTLRVLWLGQVNVRKGIHYLMGAARLLEREKIQFDVVGPIGISEAAIKSAPSNMTLHGPVSRDRAAEWYERSDVFVLPTLSDGFALTQIEAMAHGLPVIATPNCGEVVTDGVDGFIVPARDANALAQVIRQFLAEPGLLERQRTAALEKSKKFTLDKLAEKLRALEDKLRLES